MSHAEIIINRRNYKMKILVAPDSYKGSLTAIQVAEIIRSAFDNEIPDVQIELAPMADGGEGTLNTILSVNKGLIIESDATGPSGQQVKSNFGIINSTKTAVIETANVV